MAEKQQVRADIREFLTTRRARITPEQAGLRAYGGSRRVKGLRREEVATLAGISSEYYTRLERGNVKGVSESVLNGIAHALQLTDAERTHLVDLIRAVSGSRPVQRRRPPQVRVRPTVQRILDSLTMAPGFVVDGRLNILAANELGRALYAPIFDDPIQPPNHARFLFLDRRAGDFWRDWTQAADDAVALLRAAVGRDPYDRQLSDLIGELSTRSDDFRVRWATHDVRAHLTGLKRIHHPEVGNLELPFESTPLPADTGQHLVIYSPEPGSPSYAALRILASWAAKPNEGDPAREPSARQEAEERSGSRSDPA
ncbi:helix-turn-helix domain-containing protein [Actinoallomurus rhizosphaericola]|uniref:helix-turn-helix domain-containing protein n=1 Tax=Actinoallomurus rhizosphaericola TaxID=2952536 RepID=UPI002093917D|nr:helix-turn-helix transcriptional regulator [Actinoallomurus rhizosphaericola]MCO5997035.1 helix-turn-helix transcriptional regulator [Actinoallomurus rhizosphaericola]